MVVLVVVEMVAVLVVLVEHQPQVLQTLAVVVGGLHRELGPQVVQASLSFQFLRHNQPLIDTSTQHQVNGQHHQELLQLIMF
jgi:hypothetical protein